jgi:hypothetical protein
VKVTPHTDKAVSLFSKYTPMNEQVSAANGRHEGDLSLPCGGKMKWGRIIRD